MNKEALIIVDVQNDFCPGGKLAVRNGDKVVGPLNEFSRYLRDQQGLLVATRDWHPASSRHFSENGGLWPIHCVQETPGAKFHPGLDLNGAVIISKGMGEEENAYSGFDGRTEDGPGLEELLKENRINRLYIGGLATDYCVKSTAIDGAYKGFEVWLLNDAVRAVNINPEDGRSALQEMVNHHISITTVRKLLRESCGR